MASGGATVPEHQTPPFLKPKTFSTLVFPPKSKSGLSFWKQSKNKSRSNSWKRKKLPLLPLDLDCCFDLVPFSTSPQLRSPFSLFDSALFFVLEDDSLSFFFGLVWNNFSLVVDKLGWTDLFVVEWVMRWFSLWFSEKESKMRLDISDSWFFEICLCYECSCDFLKKKKGWMFLKVFVDFLWFNLKMWKWKSD